MGLHNALTLFKLLYLTNHITFLLTYKLSQDHIETLFSAVRSKGGYNDNPTCRQFQAAYKRLLVHIAIVGSTNGNCAILEKTVTIPINGQSNKGINSENNLYNPVSHNHEYFNLIPRISTFIENLSIYIAGFMVKKVGTRITCNICLSFLYATTHTSALALQKDRGGLRKASIDVQTICIETEKIFKEYINDFMNKKKYMNFIVIKVKTNLFNKFSIFENMQCINNESNFC